MAKTIEVTQSSLPDFEEYANEIFDLWDSKMITNMGIKHRSLELKLLDYLNVKNLTLFSNGHLALEAIIAAFDLHGEVITTPYTFVSTTHAITRNGLTPVFCDINLEDFTMDVDCLEKLITKQTCAIIPVHVYGNVCNVEKIDQIAKKHNIKVIYDAAHSFGVTYKGKGIGSFGDASMFSFHATKVFNTIEGGAVAFKDSELQKTLNGLKNFGITGTETVEYIGGNAKMNEFQAAMGICNLRHIDVNILKRKEIFERYIHNLKDVKGIILPIIQEGVTSNYSYFPVIFKEFTKNRDEIFELLKLNNINSRKYFYPLTSDFSCYKYDSERTPNAKFISERVLTLPLYPSLTMLDVDRICNIILNVGENY